VLGPRSVTLSGTAAMREYAWGSCGGWRGGYWCACWWWVSGFSRGSAGLLAGCGGWVVSGFVVAVLLGILSFLGLG
jgi:hypothetical protein